MFKPDTKILLVEDSSSLRTITQNMLKELGYTQITEASDGEQALKTLQQRVDSVYPIELVISDIHMPKMNGVTLLMKMRQSEKLKKLPFIALTIETDRELILEALSYGISDYVLKPTTRKILEQKINSTWKKHYGQNS